MIYLCNSFTLSMISPSLLEGGAIIKASPISLGEVKALLKEGFVSAVGHESTARVLSSLLGTDVPFNRAQISIKEGDVIVSFQFLVRLPEGKVLGDDEVLALYNEGKIKFFRVEVILPTEVQSQGA
ncbi:MAG: STIV orfB116 family protein [Thermocrinis sp.]|uniref:STIV orfB116 family protein n=1 Tax=Thermocrinis sp. TaxID=2024383 RepID=UPI003C01474A